MTRKQIYLLLALAGFVVPYSQFVSWVLEHGLNLRLLFADLFANRIGAFFGADVLISALVLFVFLPAERSRLEALNGGFLSWPCSLLAFRSDCPCSCICGIQTQRPERSEWGRK